jgi:hypothetical protein
MERRRQDAGELARLEQKIDRLSRLVILVAVCQPVLLVGLIMPDAATQIVTAALLALLIVLITFPNLEIRLPPLMRRAGRTFGRLRSRHSSVRSLFRRSSRSRSPG